MEDEQDYKPRHINDPEPEDDLNDPSTVRNELSSPPPTSQQPSAPSPMPSAQAQQRPTNFVGKTLFDLDQSFNKCFKRKETSDAVAGEAFGSWCPYSWLCLILFIGGMVSYWSVERAYVEGPEMCEILENAWDPSVFPEGSCKFIAQIANRTADGQTGYLKSEGDYVDCHARELTLTFHECFVGEDDEIYLHEPYTETEVLVPFLLFFFLCFICWAPLFLGSVAGVASPFVAVGYMINRSQAKQRGTQLPPSRWDSPNYQTGCTAGCLAGLLCLCSLGLLSTAGEAGRFYGLSETDHFEKYENCTLLRTNEFFFSTFTVDGGRNQFQVYTRHSLDLQTQYRTTQPCYVDFIFDPYMPRFASPDMIQTWRDDESNYEAEAAIAVVFMFLCCFACLCVCILFPCSVNQRAKNAELAGLGSTGLPQHNAQPPAYPAQPSAPPHNPEEEAEMDDLPV